MNTTNNTLDPVEGLKHAKKVVGYMRIGVMPSADNATAARQAVLAAIDQNEGSLAATALRALGAIRVGVAPSAELCHQADSEIAALLERVRESSSQALRGRFEERVRG